MNTVSTGLVLARQLVLASRNGWYGIFMKIIACHARRFVNSGDEFVLREDGLHQLMK